MKNGFTNKNSSLDSANKSVSLVNSNVETKNLDYGQSISAKANHTNVQFVSMKSNVDGNPSLQQSILKKNSSTSVLIDNYTQSPKNLSAPHIPPLSLDKDSKANILESCIKLYLLIIVKL